MRTYRNLASLFALLILLATSVRTQAQSLTKAIPDDPEVPHFITLKSIGGGSFTAEAIVSIDGKNETIKIDTMTTVDLPPKSSLNLIFKPNEGCALTRFTYQEEGSDEVAMPTPLIVFPDSCKANYSLIRTRTLRAYFEPYLGVIKNDTISLENATIWQPIIVGDTTTMQTYTSVINLSDVRASVLTVQERANAMFNLKGTNNLDTITNNGTLIFQAEKDATLSVKRVMNNGVLRDSTGFIRAVEIGVETDAETDAKTGDMLISIETKSKNIIEAQGDSVELPMSYNIIDNSRDNMAYLQGSKWQKLVGDVWEDLPDQKTLLRTNTTANKDVAVENADYRYLLNIKVENSDTKEVKGEVTLTTYMSVVDLNPTPDPDPDPDPTPDPDPDPDPDPTPDPEPIINLTLPAIEGATTMPAAGIYEIEKGEGFSFLIVLDEDYDQSKPIVKVNGKVLEPDADGIYQLTRLSDDVTITIEGIVKNEEDPTSISGAEDNVTKVWASHGYLHIQSYEVRTAYIISTNGKLYKILTLPEGETVTAMPQGVYIVRIGGQSYKLRF